MNEPTSDQLLYLRELFEERAAIKEHDGKMSRAQAEREAFEEVYGVKVKGRSA